MPLPDLSKYEKFVDLTNGRMRYYEAGSGDEHTILVPSTILGASADTFQFVIELLAERLHVYAIDNLGFGLFLSEVVSSGMNGVSIWFKSYSFRGRS